MFTIALGSDHAGFALKAHLVEVLGFLGYEVLDLGTHSSDRVDYPQFGDAVGRAVVSGGAEMGICVCGTGLGIAMAANKVPGIRAAPVHDVTSARMAKEHNDCNVLCLGERLMGITVAEDCVKAWLNATFEGGRHQRRVSKLDALGG